MRHSIIVSQALVLFSAVLLAPLAVAETMEERCAGVVSSQPDALIIAIPEMTVDESRSTTEDLAFMAGTYNSIDRQIGGITSAEPLIAHEISPNLGLLPNGEGVCARPSIVLTVGYASMSVFMDREIPRSSCIYNAIFAHEMHHVNIYKDYLNRNSEQIKQRMEEKFNGRVYYFKSIFAAKQYVEILGQVFTQHVGEKFLGEVYAEQHALDTQSEYTRMQKECYH